MNTPTFHEKNSIHKPLVLVGLMGCGKTHIGQALSQKLNIPFYDSDSVIVEEQGCSIADIFAQKGEAYFREVEENTIAKLLQKGVAILSTGGGAMMNTNTQKAMASLATSVWLTAPIDVLIDRMEKDTSRPLLQGYDLKERLEQLYNERKDTYAKADIHIESDGQTEEVLQKILSALNTNS